MYTQVNFAKIEAAARENLRRKKLQEKRKQKIIERKLIKDLTRHLLVDKRSLTI